MCIFVHSGRMSQSFIISAPKRIKKILRSSGKQFFWPDENIRFRTNVHLGFNCLGRSNTLILTSFFRLIEMILPEREKNEAL